jgi:hypothetical protein
MKTKKAIIRFVLVFIGIVLFQKSFSQENYLPGYVINLKGDTIHGFIDYRNWKTNPAKFSFREKMDTSPVFYKPVDIIEFSVKDEIYVSGIVDLEMSPLRTNELTEDPLLQIKVDTAFLQTLFKGKKPLYYYYNYGRDNFYIKHDNKFELLLYKKFLKRKGEESQLLENKTYINQLEVYLRDCPSVSPKVNNTTYNENNFIKLFQYYYECSQTEIIFQRKADKAYVGYGILAGASVSSIDFSGAVLDYLVNAEFNQSTNASAGLFLELFLPRHQGRWSVNNELFISDFNFKSQYDLIVNSDKYTKTASEIGYTYLKINSMARYKYPIGNLFVYLNAGLSYGSVIRETNYKKVETKFYTNEDVVEGHAMDDIRKYELGELVGTGIKYKKLSFEIRYEQGNGMAIYDGFHSKTKRYFVLLGYKF